MTEPTRYTFSIPEFNMEQFESAMKRIQRKAKKLGSTIIPSYDVTGYDDRRQWSYTNLQAGYTKVGYCKADETSSNLTGVIVRFYSVDVFGPAPRLNGWKFVGVIDAVVDADDKVVGNMLRLMPGTEAVPEKFRSCGPWCDHCGVNRHWRSTYIVKHDDGTYKQVGSRCLADFTGHDGPEQIAAEAEALMELFMLGGDGGEDNWDEEGGGGRRWHRFQIKDVLQVAATLVRLDGFHTTAEDHRSTASQVYWALTLRTEKEAGDFTKKYPLVEYDQQLAAKVFTWMLELSEKDSISDYEHNLMLCAQAGMIDKDMLGIAVSAVPSYLRFMERELTRQQAALTSEFIGQTGLRRNFTLILTGLRPMESEYGTRTLCRFRTEQGSVVIWWASKAIMMPQGTKLVCKATVSKHTTYQGVKQTEVRCLTILSEELPDTQVPITPEKSVEEGIETDQRADDREELLLTVDYVDRQDWHTSHPGTYISFRAKEAFMVWHPTKRVPLEVGNILRCRVTTTKAANFPDCKLFNVEDITIHEVVTNPEVTAIIRNAIHSKIGVAA